MAAHPHTEHPHSPTHPPQHTHNTQVYDVTQYLADQLHPGLLCVGWVSRGGWLGGWMGCAPAALFI